MLDNFATTFNTNIAKAIDEINASNKDMDTIDIDYSQAGKDENGNLVPYHLGHFFIAIDTNHFLGEELTRHKAGEILRSIRASKKAPGAERIYTAGEKEYLVWLQRKDSGVPVSEPVQKEMCKVRDDLKLDYTFPWEK